MLFFNVTFQGMFFHPFPAVHRDVAPLWEFLFFEREMPVRERHRLVISRGEEAVLVSHLFFILDARRRCYFISRKRLQHDIFATWYIWTVWTWRNTATPQGNHRDSEQHAERMAGEGVSSHKKAVKWRDPELPQRHQNHLARGSWAPASKWRPFAL